MKNAEIYSKSGRPNYKEKKLIDEIKKAVEANPALSNKYAPATTFADLQKLHQKYVSTTVDFEELQDQTTDDGNNHQSDDADDLDFDDDNDNNNSSDQIDDEDFIPNEVVDPLNADEPIVRDYVMQNQFENPEGNSTDDFAQSTFAEPVTFTDAFELPTSDDEKETVNSNANSNAKSGNQSIPPPKTPPNNGNSSNDKSGNSFNSDFENMDNAKKKRKAKKFAKYIVNTVCLLAEKGFVYLANQPISPEKLREYEMNGEIDLDILLELTDGQEITIRDFFARQRNTAVELSKIDPEEKEDLADALTEVMLEKNIAPTPMQELMLFSLKILGQQGASLYMLTQENKAVLSSALTHVSEEEDTEFSPEQQTATGPIPGEQEGSFENPENTSTELAVTK